MRPRPHPNIAGNSLRVGKYPPAPRLFRIAAPVPLAWQGVSLMELVF